MKEVEISQIWIARCVVILSLLFFAARAVEYILIGSFAPFGLVVILGAVITLSFLWGEKSANRSVKLFGFILILYGIVRVILGIVLKFAPIDSMHAIENTSVLYFAVSALYFCGGLYLFKHPILFEK